MICSDAKNLLLNSCDVVDHCSKLDVLVWKNQHWIPSYPLTNQPSCGKVCASACQRRTCQQVSRVGRHTCRAPKVSNFLVIRGVDSESLSKSSGEQKKHTSWSLPRWTLMDFTASFWTTCCPRRRCCNSMGGLAFHPLMIPWRKSIQ